MMYIYKIVLSPPGGSSLTLAPIKRKSYFMSVGFRTVHTALFLAILLAMYGVPRGNAHAQMNVTSEMLSIVGER